MTPDIVAGASIEARQDELIEMPQEFPQRMRVTYLPEEIKPVRSNLGSGPPRLGLAPVDELLLWDEA